jgi:hypothetical protein
MEVSMLNKLLAATLLALGALPTHAADGFRSEYRLGMDESAFRKANEQFFGEGLRLVDLTVSDVGGRPVIGAIWQRFGDMPAPSAERTKSQLESVFLKLDEAGLRQAGKRLGEQGSQVEVMDAYIVDGKTWFAASFAPPDDSVMQSVGAFLTPEQVGEMRKDAVATDNDLMRIDAYGENGDLRMLPVFVARGEAELDMKILDSTLQVSAANVAMYLADLQPLSISQFEIDGDTKWLAVWDKGPGRDFVLFDRGEKIREKASGGGIVIDLDSSASDTEVYYSAVVQKPR